MPRLTLSIFLILIGFELSAQYNQGGVPKSFEISQGDNFYNARLVKKLFKTITLIPPSENRRDSILSDPEKAPYSFIDCTVDFLKEATVETLDNGNRIYRLSMKADGAKSLSFFFSNFIIPWGCEFFLYDIDKRVIKGMFNAASMNRIGSFGVSDTQGSEMVLEYYELKEAESFSVIIIDAVEYEFKQ